MAGAAAAAAYSSVQTVEAAAGLKKRYSIVDEDDLDGDSIAVPKWTPPSRKEMKEAMKSVEFDVLVIGGGATGAGCAMDASTRGLKTALVERDDFASGTSSRSTKLIHGGIRYLAQAFQSKIPPNTLLDVFMHLRYNHDYMKIVSADLAERAYMIESAPFMTHPIPMMVRCSLLGAPAPPRSHALPRIRRPGPPSNPRLPQSPQVPLYKWWEVPMMLATVALAAGDARDRRARWRGIAADNPRWLAHGSQRTAHSSPTPLPPLPAL